MKNIFVIQKTKNGWIVYKKDIEKHSIISGEVHPSTVWSFNSFEKMMIELRKLIKDDDKQLGGKV